MARRPLKELVCSEFKWREADYEGEVFRVCLYPHARLLARVLRKMSPHLFDDDLRLIRHVSDSVSSRDIDMELTYFQDELKRSRNVLRKHLKMRVSGRKLARLASHAFAHQNDG